MGDSACAGSEVAGLGVKGSVASVSASSFFSTGAAIPSLLVSTMILKVVQDNSSLCHIDVVLEFFRERRGIPLYK